MHRRVFRIHEGVEEQVGAGVPMWLSKCGKQGAGRLTKPGGRRRVLTPCLPAISALACPLPDVASLSVSPRCRQNASWGACLRSQPSAGQRALISYRFPAIRRDRARGRSSPHLVPPDSAFPHADCLPVNTSLRPASIVCAAHFFSTHRARRESNGIAAILMA